MERQTEIRTEEIIVTLTPHEKATLQQLSFEHGASMRGFIRKLIHDAARNTSPDLQLQKAGRYAAGQ